MKTLLAFFILIIASVAWAVNPTAFNEGNCIRIVGGQNLNMDATDEVYVSKTAIQYVLRHTKTRVEIRLVVGSYSYSFSTEDQARAFATQIAAWVVAK